MANLKDAVYGAAVGDALGVPYEFMGRDTFECTGMASGGAHNMPEGEDFAFLVDVASWSRD